MLINCTQKLQKLLKISPNKLEQLNPLFSWHANIMLINRRKVLVLVNDESRYNVVLYGLKANDFKNMEAVICDGIRKSLLSDGVNPKVIEEYFNYTDGIDFSKTQNKTTVARINKACNDVFWFSERIEDKQIVQIGLSDFLNDRIAEFGKGIYLNRLEHMIYALEQCFDIQVIKCRAIEMKITLLLENFEVWRRVIVPINYTFESLHKVIQKVFGWEGHHIHAFDIFNNGIKVVNLVDDEEALMYEYDAPMIVDKDITIEEYMLKCYKIIYTYDFGDNWKHLIEIEETVENYDKNQAYCIEGIGDRPPEDVGSEEGYINFKKIMEDPSHPEHTNAKEWLRQQRYDKFDIYKINKMLKHL